jgi:multiple sugar transport system substrate-binding protein
MRATRLSRREFLRASALTVAGAGLAACAVPAALPESAGTGAAQPPAPQRSALTLWGWWDQRMAIYQSAGNQFTEANPDVEVRVETLPGGELQQKVYSAVAAGTGPSLLKMGEFFFKMREQDMLLPFPEDIFPDSWFEDMYPNVNWDAYGRYVVPTGSTGTILVYNKKMFADAGFDPESPPKTWDDFIQVAQAVTQTDASGRISRCAFVPADEWPGLSQCYQLGGNIVRREGDRQEATFDSPEMEKALQYLIADMVAQYEVWDPTFPSNIESVGTGLAAMTEDQSWIVGEFRTTYADLYPDLGFAANPTPTGQPDPFYGYKSTVLDVSALKGRPEDYEATFRFLEFLFKEGKEFYWQLCDLISCAPERKDLFDDPRLASSPGLVKAAEVLPFEHDPVQPPEELGSIWANVISQIAIDGKPVAEACAYGNEELQKLLDQGLAQYLQ